MFAGHWGPFTTTLYLMASTLAFRVSPAGWAQRSKSIRLWWQVLITSVLPGFTASNFPCYLIVKLQSWTAPTLFKQKTIKLAHVKHKDWLHLSGQLLSPISLSLEHLLTIQRPLPRSHHNLSSRLKASCLPYITFSHSRTCTHICYHSPLSN